MSVVFTGVLVTADALAKDALMAACGALVAVLGEDSPVVVVVAPCNPLVDWLDSLASAF